MTRRSLALLLVFSALMSACSPATEEATTTTSTVPATTTTSMPATTTTTTPPFSLKGSPPGLTATIEGFYDFAAGRTTTQPKAPWGVLRAIEISAAAAPENGVARVAEFKGQPIAVVTVGRDFFLAVKDGPTWRIVGGKWPSLSVPAFFGPKPRLVAVVGSDARPGQDVERSRADSIHFVGLDGKGSAAVVGVPRDSFVPIPGYGTSKITGSLSAGGPEMMMDTFTEMTGLEFDGYVLTGFAGFEALLSEVLGEVTVEVPFGISDRWAHVDLDAGEQALDGAEALGFARARKTVPGGDLTRSAHQGVILIGALMGVRQMGITAVPGLLEKAEPHLSTDLSPAELLTFSAMALATNPDGIQNEVAPGSPGSAGGASVVYLSSSVTELWEDLADGRLGE